MVPFLGPIHSFGRRVAGGWPPVRAAGDLLPRLPRGERLRGRQQEAGHVAEAGPALIKPGG